MRDFAVLKFFENTTSVGTSIKSLPTLTSQVIIEVHGASTLSLKIYGTCYKDREDSDDAPYSVLAFVNLSDFSAKNEITKPGIYQFSVDGIYKLKAELLSTSGEVTVIGKAGG